MRKKRSYEAVCHCRKYPFPHRMFGGRCNGAAFVAHHFSENQAGSCFFCPLNRGECDVVAGLEHPKECRALEDFTEREEIRLPLKWRPQAIGFQRGFA